MIFVVGEEEKAGTCVHLQGKRDVVEFVLDTGNGVQSKDEIGMMTYIAVVCFRIVVIFRQGSADVQSAAHKPVEAVARGGLVHHIGVERQNCRDIIVHVIPHETISEVKLYGEVIGRECLEFQAVHKTDGCTDRVIIGSGIETALCERGNGCKYNEGQDKNNLSHIT